MATEKLRSALAKLGSGKLRWKLAEIAIEAVMIVFAVLVALGDVSAGRRPPAMTW